MKNLVMGAAKGFDWEILEPFVTSFARNCPNAELVLFVDDISDVTRDCLLSFDRVLLEDFPEELRSGVPNNMRWKVLTDFLEAHGDDYEQIFATDTRDVIFQGDVFAPFKGYTNWLGYVTEFDDIGGSKRGVKTNYIWITDCFGKEMADSLVEKKIICDGTVIGSLAEMKIFCRAMWKKVLEVTERFDFRIHDQAVANYLIYNNHIPIKNFVEINSDSGEILTTVNLANNFSVNKDFILRPNGGVPAVIHQYNRYDELVQLVDNVYRDKNFQPDGRLANLRSNLEKLRQLIYAAKFNEAILFFMKNFLDGADFSGCVERLLRLWQFLLKRPLTPAVGYLELAIQNTLASVKKFPIQNLNAVCLLLTHSIKNRRTVDQNLVNFIVSGLMNIAKKSLAANAATEYFYCMDAIKSLDLPLNKNFYLLQAKAFRTFGRKDEALAAYQKVLELS